MHATKYHVMGLKCWVKHERGLCWPGGITKERFPPSRRQRWSQMVTSPVPLIATARQDGFYIPVLHFLKLHIDCLSEFCLGISQCIHTLLIQINPLCHLLFLHHAAPLLLTSLQCIL
jgi:hypothetical protein